MSNFFLIFSNGLWDRRATWVDMMYPVSHSLRPLTDESITFLVASILKAERAWDIFHILNRKCSNTKPQSCNDNPNQISNILAPGERRCPPPRTKKKCNGLWSGWGRAPNRYPSKRRKSNRAVKSLWDINPWRNPSSCVIGWLRVRTAMLNNPTRLMESYWTSGRTNQ